MKNIAAKIRNEFYENVYPIYQCKYGLRYGFLVMKILNWLNTTQWLPQDGILALQTEKFRNLIKHVYDSVPYYSEIMKKIGLCPEEIKSLEDIRYLPILTKDDIRRNFKKLISHDSYKRKFINASTGGSTGEPLKYIRDWNSLIWTEAASLRGMSWAQYRIGDTFVDLMSADWPSVMGKIRGKMLNKHYFPAFAKDYELISYVKTIEKLHPICVAGYPSNLYRIANIYQRHKIFDIKFRVIFTTGEILYDYQREFFEKYFNGRVFDHYGCNEVGSIAYECEHHQKHIADERFLMETTDSKGTAIINQLGKITITDLDNYTMPFIRYQNGDVGRMTSDHCICGRGLKVVKSIEGRTQDFLRTLDGNYVPAIFFPSRFRNLTGINQYQIIQKDVHNISLKIVKNQFFSAKELEEILRVIREMIGNNVNVGIEECSYIPLTRSGKYRLVISLLPIDLSFKKRENTES